MRAAIERDIPVVVGTSTGLTFSNSLSHIDTTTWDVPPVLVIWAATAVWKRFMYFSMSNMALRSDQMGESSLDLQGPSSRRMEGGGWPEVAATLTS